jgi:hypothetical protein
LREEIQKLCEFQKEQKERQREAEARSMRDNLIFKGIAEVNGENPDED